MRFKEEYKISRNFSLEEYDNYMKKKPLEQRIILNKISEIFNGKINVKLVEFGAGTGRFTKLLIKRFPDFKITAVEPDKNCCLKLQRLADKHKDLKVIQLTAENFPKNERFDIVAMATAFHHVGFDKKLRFLKVVRNILARTGVFVLADNFIAEYKSMKERDIVLRKSMDRWIRGAIAEKDAEELRMARKMKKLVFRKDFGGEYFICNSKFEGLVKKSGMKIREKINTTNTDPLDMEIYLYLMGL